MLDAPLSRLLVHSIGSLAHDPQVGGLAVTSIEQHIARCQRQLQPLREAVRRETRRERERRRPTLELPTGGAVVLTVDDGGSSSSRPRPPPRTDSQPSLPAISVFAVRSVASLISDLCIACSQRLHDASRVSELLDVFFSVLQDEGLLTLANGSRSCHPELEQALQPLFDLLISVLSSQQSGSNSKKSAASTVWQSVREQAVGLLLVLSLARGSLQRLLDVLRLLQTQPSLVLPRVLLAELSARYGLPQPGPEERLSGVEAMAALLSQMRALADRVCPLDVSHLPLSCSSSVTGNSNSAPLLYHPFCLQLSPQVLSQLSSLLLAFTSDEADSSGSIDVIVVSLLRLLIVHFQQLVLLGPAAFPPYHSALSLYPHLLSLLYRGRSLPQQAQAQAASVAADVPSHTARLIAFAFPFFFPSLSESLPQLHRLLADWGELQSSLSTPTVMKANFSFTQEMDESKQKEMADDSKSASAFASHRSSLLLSPPQLLALSQQQQQTSPRSAGRLSLSEASAAALSTPLTISASSSSLPPRDPMQLYLTRLLLLRYCCFPGAMLIVDALLDSSVSADAAASLSPPSPSVTRDSAVQLIKDLLSVVQYEVKQRMRAEQQQTPSVHRAASASSSARHRHHRSLSVYEDESQAVETETELLLRLCIDLLEVVQTQLLSRQADLYEEQDRAAAEKRSRQQQRQEEADDDEAETAKDEQQQQPPADSASSSDGIPAVPSVSVELSSTPPFSRRGSVIATVSFSPADYCLYYASSILLSGASMLGAAYDIHRFYALPSSYTTPSSSAHQPSAAAVSSSGGYQQLLGFLRRLCLPLVVVTSGFVSSSRPLMSASLLSSLTAFLEQLTRINRIGPFLAQQESSGAHDDGAAAAGGQLVVSSTVDSLHPYRPFTDEFHLLTLPPFPLPAHTLPSTVTLTFDPLCSTASKYDYVELLSLHPFYSEQLFRSQCFTASHDEGKGAAPLHHRSLSQRFHGGGLHGASSFPTSPLTFHGEHVVLHFHSGTSYRAARPVTDSAAHFGFSVRVEACFPSPLSVSPPLHSPAWCSELLHASSHLAGSLCACLIRGQPTGDGELAADHWLHTAVFSGGLDKDALPADLNTQLAMAAAAAAASSLPPPASELQQRARHTQFLHELMQYDAASTAADSSSASRLMSKLKKANVDRQIVQRSIAASAQSISQAVFALLLKQTDRVEAAIVCGDRADQRLDGGIVKLWRKAVEIKLDIRSQHDSTQDVSQLVADIHRRVLFMLQLQSVQAQLEQIRTAEQRELAASGRTLTEKIRRQSSFSSVAALTSPPLQPPPLLMTMSSPLVLLPDVHHRVASVDIEELARRSGRPTFDRPQHRATASVSTSTGSAAALWSRQKAAGSSMLSSTIRAMRMLKSLMRLRTRAVDSSADSEDPVDSVAAAVFQFLREKQQTGKLLSALSVALHQQKLRAEYRVLGLQAVRQLCTRLLLLRAQGDASTLNTPAASSLLSPST